MVRVEDEGVAGEGAGERVRVKVHGWVQGFRFSGFRFSGLKIVRL